MTSTPTGLLAAERALASGDADGAIELLAARADPASLHLRAIANRRAGRLDEARRDFEAAIAAAPRDPQVANNYANLLRQIGERALALQYYDRALAIDKTYRDAGFNKALVLSEMGDAEGALAILEGLCAANRGDARAHSARGAVLRQLGRHDRAASAYDAALGAQPDLPTALNGRAQIALERGEDSAVDFFHRAAIASPGDLDVFHGYAEALEAAGQPAVGEVLERVLAVQPGWIAGHVLLARIEAERGHPDCTRIMRQAAARDPANHALAAALANTLAAAGDWHGALAALPASDDPRMAVTRAHYLSEAGRPAEALALIGNQTAASMPHAIAAARAHLRLSDTGAAAAILERAVAHEPDAIGAWGLLEVVWRLAGDPRSEWLSGRANLIGIRDLALGASEIDGLAGNLRALHRTRAHPIGQSLRGGTQTRGNLFLREDPALARLREAILAAIAAYRADLPPTDPAHPLLRHRDTPLKIGGSWSVRLAGSGFHVSHIHPEGVLSSACYIALPDLADSHGSRPGWLELGRPPAELGIDLEPLAMIEPRPGRLALFPSYLFHGTRPFAKGERLTVAFDVVPA